MLRIIRSAVPTLIKSLQVISRTFGLGHRYTISAPTKNDTVEITHNFFWKMVFNSTIVSELINGPHREYNNFQM